MAVELVSPPHDLLKMSGRKAGGCSVAVISASDKSTKIGDVREGLGITCAAALVASPHPKPHKESAQERGFKAGRKTPQPGAGRGKKGMTGRPFASNFAADAGTLCVLRTLGTGLVSGSPSQNLAICDYGMISFSKKKVIGKPLKLAFTEVGTAATSRQPCPANPLMSSIVGPCVWPGRAPSPYTYVG